MTCKSSPSWAVQFPSRISLNVCAPPHRQGTGAVSLAALMTAVGVTKSKLSEQRIVVYGAGTAGLGITKQLRDGMGTIDALSTAEANKRFYLLDRYGLIKESLGPDKIRPGLREFVRPDAEWADVPTNDKGEVGLLDVVRKVRPTVLIGCSTHTGAFTEEVIKEMARGTERPIIFPLSNPTRLVEVTPERANEWTNGKALMATGSPFPPCKMPNGKMYEIAECNSTFSFHLTFSFLMLTLFFLASRRRPHLPWPRLWCHDHAGPQAVRHDDHRCRAEACLAFPCTQRPR